MSSLKSIIQIVAIAAAVCSCTGNDKKSSAGGSDDEKITEDDCSFANVNQARITHLNWDVTVDFDTRTISGSAEYDIVNHDTQEIVFDTQDDLEIDSVILGNGRRAEFSLGGHNEVLGTPLRVAITPETKKVKIWYRTTPQARALQWLNPQQTAGKTDPYLLTQGQAILTRSYIPIQDTPGIRITYNARVKVPKGLLALMSAVNPREKNETGVYEFTMEQPIPPYLMALAVGNIGYRAFDGRTGVYTEPVILDDAAWELAETPKMVDAAEKLYGRKYPWGQYDVLILPPSFPFGGMENPRLTFATPTILAGDRSLTPLIAHELAHSWSGNLVTNATWDDFWLNEGFTVYFERRIMERLHGKQYVRMLEVLGVQDLRRSIRNLGPENPYTALKIHLNGHNPDDAFSDVPYEKGAFFLRFLEKRYGREKFDAFLQHYFGEHAFTTMTTEHFIDIMKRDLTGGEDEFVQRWVYEPGMPELDTITSERFEKVSAAFDGWMKGDLAPGDLDTDDWTTYEWLHFLRAIPADMGVEKFGELDGAFSFTTSGNSEIAALWYEKSILAGYDVVMPQVKKFLVRVGRRKFLTPLYTALVKAGKKDKALEIYTEARPNYHAVSFHTIDKLLDYGPGE